MPEIIDIVHIFKTRIFFDIDNAIFLSGIYL